MNIKNKILGIVKLPKKIFIILSIILLGILLVIGIGGYAIINSMTNGNDGGMTSYSESASFDNIGPVYSKTDKMMLSQKNMMIAEPIFREESAKYDEDIERQIIKNGNLSLVVSDLETAKQKVEKIVKKFNGFIQSANFSENEYRNNYGIRNEYQSKQITFRNGSYQLKIPAKNFEAAFSEFKKIALKVNHENIFANDVTEKYQDLKTQIKNKKAEEEQYRIILKKSGKISDVLEVTKYLNTARKERERLEGRLNYLSNQVELSSITVNLVAEEDVAVMGVVWSPLTELKVGLRNFLEDGKDFVNSIISFLFRLPFYLIWLLIIIFGAKFIWKIIKKIKNKIRL